MHAGRKPCTFFNSASSMRSNEEFTRYITKGKGRRILICAISVLFASLFVMSCFSGCAAKTSTLSEVDLTETYTTQRSETLSYDCPTLSFSYPASWHIADSSTAGYGELISLVNSEGTLEIKFAQWTGGSLHSYDFEYKNREKMADALFVPRNTETYNYADEMGKLAVIKGRIIVDGKDEGICYSLLPESALSNNRFLGAFNKRPSFSYSSDVSFTCLIEEGCELSSQDKAEILAILGSLVDVDS